MASIQFIEKRIAGKEKEIEKLQKKLARIEEAKATGWEKNPYYYDERDLKWTTKDLEAAQNMLEKYKADLTAEQEKANSRNVPAILEFLEGWKKRVTEYYEKTAEQYPEAIEKYYKDMKEHTADYYQEQKMKKERPEEYEEYIRVKKDLQETFTARFGHVTPYMERKYNPETNRMDAWEFLSDKLAKELEQEANRKYDFIIERTNKIVGTIEDASALEIGAKGDLNGYIVGPKGTAKVQTIGAGGYNIQCFHFRTLINKMK